MMLKHRFLRAGPKGIIYNEKYFGPTSTPSFSSYINDINDFPSKDLLQVPWTGEDETVKKAVSSPDLDVTKSLLVEKPTFKRWRSNKSGLDGSVLRRLEELRKGDNLEKFLEAHGLSTSGVSVPHLKHAFDNFLSKHSDQKKKEILRWEEQVERLRELKDEQKLEEWLESLGVPANSVSVLKVKEQLEQYFHQPHPHNKELKLKIDEPEWGKRKDKEGSDNSDSNSNVDKASITSSSTSTSSSEVAEAPITKTRVKRDFGPCQPLQEFNGRSLIYQENTLAHKLWEEFRGMSAPKQVAVIVGITVVTGVLGFLSWRILLLAFPSMFQMNGYWGEVLAQWFMQRQESSFHLFQHTAQNAKPLSTAWANQYLLWKYI